MTTYKLTYFDARGRAEVARYLFTAAKKEFTDVRIKREEWPALKPKTPFGQIPILEVTTGGKSEVYAQSGAIYRFLAREFGFYGESNLDALLIDQLVEHMLDIFAAVTKIMFGTPEADRPAALKTFGEGLPAKVKLLESHYSKNEGPYLLGNKISFADIMFARFTDDLDKDGAITKTLPNLQKAREALDKEFKAYREKRPETKF